MVRTMFILMIFVLLKAAAWAVIIDESAFAAEDVIERDVAIIGGGASGTYAAVRLREDHDISVVVVEKEDHLGGHVNTYLDPVSGVPIDYGVIAYLRYGHAADFFARFDVPIKPYAAAPQDSLYVSTGNGSLLTGYTPPAFPDQLAAFEVWLNATEKYADLMLPGLWNFPNGADIPPELLMPFGDFARKYGIEATAPLFTTISNVGVGGIEKVLTLYVMFAMGEPVTREFLTASLFVPDGFSNSELYRRAYSLLQDDILLESKVRHAERNDDGVRLVVRQAGCKDKLIKAKKLLFTPPPSLARLSPFGLDSYERQVLGTWTPTWSFAAIAKVSAIPSNTSVYWYSPDIGSSDYLSMRDWPWTLSLTSAPDVPAEEHLFEVLFATNYSVTHAEAKSTITVEIQKLCDGDALQESVAMGGECEVDFKAFVDHNSVLWRQSQRQLRNNIVQEIYALQGRKSTWYTGGLWSADYTGNVWAFTDSLLPRLVQSLETEIVR